MARRTIVLWTVLLCGSLGLIGCAGSQSTSESANGTPSAGDVTVAVYDDTAITLSEFERAYERTNSSQTPASDSLAAYETFLQQYLNYRLKVRAAQEAGLDTLGSIQKEIRAYRQKMARPKLMRKHVYEPLARSLYERKQTEVDVSHILARVASDAPPADTLDAYRKMQSIADSLQRGVPFSELAYRNSEDPSAQKKGKRGYKGHIGYIRAGQIVKPFEDRMYNVRADSVSDIFRTRFGYHILKVHDRRPARRPVRLSHIMVRPDGDSTKSRHFLDSLRTELVSGGASFSEVAKTHSEDQRTATRGGDLGTIQSTQALPPSFRTAVSRLDSVGTVSDVVKSRFGYHLIKLTGRESPSSFEDSYDELKKEIADRPRVEKRKVSFARQVRSNEGTSVDTAHILRSVHAASVDTVSRPLLTIANDENKGAASIATLGDSSYTLNQLARHVMQTDGGARMTIGEVVDDFLNEQAFSYAGARLARRDSSFAATMDEYRNGLLVFQFMQDSVWTAAAEDSAGLRRTYQENPNKYRYPDRVRAVELRAPTDSLLKPYADTTSDVPPIQSLVDRATVDSLVSVDTIMVTDDSPDVYQPLLSEKDGAVMGPVEYDGSALVLVRDTLLLARQKTFSEARSQVISDYQDVYEKRVLKTLRRRYDAKAYPSRLQRAFSGSSKTRASSTP